MAKIATKCKKPEKYVVEQISKRASRQGISSLAEQVLWAKQVGISTGLAQRKLPPHVQEEIRDLLPTIFARQPHTRRQLKRESKAPRKQEVTLAIEYLLLDRELRDRCADLLRARRNFDRVFREATTVLDDRLKKLSRISHMNPSAVVARALHPPNALLRVSPDEDEQKGFFLICSGLFLAFRNPTHHQLSDKFTRENALQFCGFVDSLLALLGQATYIPP